MNKIYPITRSVNKITGLMVCDPNGVISVNGSIPWHYPDEIQFFRGLIADQIIILGYKTYLEMPKWLLENSYCIVFSQKYHEKSMLREENLVFVSSIGSFLNLKKVPSNKACFIIGGRQLVNHFFEHQLIDAFLLTVINKCYWGDTFLSLNKFLMWSQKTLVKTSDFNIYYYTNPFSRCNA